MEVRLHERVALDAYGLRNMDFRLDSVDPHGSVAFLFEDRTGHHFGQRRSLGFAESIGQGHGFFRWDRAG